MEIRILPIEQINAAAYNPRVDLQPGDPEYEKLKANIESFGYVEPIIWNERTGNMVGILESKAQYRKIVKAGIASGSKTCRLEI
ncbi:hypothetical protein [Paenibacillus kribbensis]|uniref:hypothetical protein n=1 Tax=Paenibacillus kribbensis TaxID=172713 RepID=UPI00211959D2|nr:hypothetical protein [Paenibacillus kribbensis]